LSHSGVDLRRETLRIKIREIALDRPRFGYRRSTDLLNRHGLKVSKNTIWSLYREECLGIKKFTRQAAKRAARIRIIPPPAKMTNERWSIDFIYDRLSNGATVRGLSVLDQFSRKCLAVSFAQSFNGSRATEVLDTVAQRIGQYPKMITLDNGPEFTGLVFDEWAKTRGIHLDFS
jgi:putative transposase